MGEQDIKRKEILGEKGKDFGEYSSRAYPLGEATDIFFFFVEVIISLGGRSCLAGKNSYEHLVLYSSIFIFSFNFRLLIYKPYLINFCIRYYS